MSAPKVSEPSTWREIVASALDWEQAHVSLDRAIEGLPAELRGDRPVAAGQQSPDDRDGENLRCGRGCCRVEPSPGSAPEQ